MRQRLPLHQPPKRRPACNEAQASSDRRREVRHIRRNEIIDHDRNPRIVLIAARVTSSASARTPAPNWSESSRYSCTGVSLGVAVLVSVGDGLGEVVNGTTPKLTVEAADPNEPYDAESTCTDPGKCSDVGSEFTEHHRPLAERCGQPGKCGR